MGLAEGGRGDRLSAAPGGDSRFQLDKVRPNPCELAEILLILDQIGAEFSRRFSSRRNGADGGGGARFYGLLQGKGDEEPEGYGGDVDEEVTPGAGGVVRGVDVEHGGWSLRRSVVWRGDRLLRRRNGVGFRHSCRYGDKSKGVEARRLDKKVGDEGA